MKDFNFEKNLPHQDRAVESTIRVFQNLQNQPPTALNANHTNPTLNINSPQYSKNIKAIREENEITEGEVRGESNILDIMMETGTGKTYTYTKTIFKLNKQFGIFKFIIVVPTLSIKAGTINFLKSQGAREHFQQQYDRKVIKPHIVASQKSKYKNKT